MPTTEQRRSLETCRERYRKDLENDIMPFRMKFGTDRRRGGVYTCLDRDGTMARPAKGDLFKGSFPVPRMMIRTWMLCNDILEK